MNKNNQYLWGGKTKNIIKRIVILSFFFVLARVAYAYYDDPLYRNMPIMMPDGAGEWQSSNRVLESNENVPQNIEEALISNLEPTFGSEPKNNPGFIEGATGYA